VVKNLAGCDTTGFEQAPRLRVRNRAKAMRDMQDRFMQDRFKQNGLAGYVLFCSVNAAGKPWLFGTGLCV
jgi:hypothetical protein